MSEENKSAKETVETTEVSENADANNESENLNGAKFADGASGQDGQEGQLKPETPKAQTQEQNSENARRRREAERQAEIKKAENAAREKAIIEILNGKNPYTEAPMKDHADVEEYLLMKEIEKSGGDPLSDFSKYQKERDRKRTEEAEKKARQREWYENDSKEFQAKHPEVNLQDLIKNENFQKYADGKVGVRPLSEIYEDFVELISEYENKANKKAAQTLANQKASPGSLSTTTSSNRYFSREQVMGMSQKEVDENYDAIRESMTKW